MQFPKAWNSRKCRASDKCNQRGVNCVSDDERIYPSDVHLTSMRTQLQAEWAELVRARFKGRGTESVESHRQWSQVVVLS